MGFEAAAFGTNCYVLAAQSGQSGQARQQCLVIDPGIGVLETLSRVLEEFHLAPVAVLATHGHLDHVYSVTPVCQAHDVPVVVHTADAYRLADPISTLDPGLVGMLEAQFGEAASWTEPDQIRQITDGEHLELAGISLQMLHAPGHTEGSVMFAVDGVPDGVRVSGGELSGTLVSGDVLFAGSIGRTDLPGGDHAAMLTSLREKVLTRPDGELVLPGHGPATTISAERATNPYLRSL